MPESQVSTLPLNKRLKNFNEVALGFPKKTAVEEARRCPQYNDPEHLPECPLGVDILGFIRFLREGNFSAAFKKIREHNDLPAVCGRICQAPCEQAFIRGENEAVISVRALERFAADHGRERSFNRRPVERKGKKVAVIGSGAAGLTAAARLAGKNYQVCIFEALPLPGGTLRYGVPHFRLPKDVLNAEIEEIRWQGVEFRTGSPVGETVPIQDLFNEGYQAVLLAVGRNGGIVPFIPGTHWGGVYSSGELLLQANLLKPGHLKSRAPLRIGRKVVVIGSDSEALDCARVCRRMGAEVTLIFPKTEEEMNVHPRDRIHSQEEGIKVEILTQPVAILAADGASVSGIQCTRMDYADPEGNGQWRVIPVPDSEFIIDADTVIFARREAQDGCRMEFSNIYREKSGAVWLDPSTGMTSVKAIFAAGEVAGCDPQLAAVMASGKKAAEDIHRFLTSRGNDGPKNG